MPFRVNKNQEIFSMNFLICFYGCIPVHSSCLSTGVDLFAGYIWWLFYFSALSDYCPNTVLLYIVQISLIKNALSSRSFFLKLWCEDTLDIKKCKKNALSQCGPFIFRHIRCTQLKDFFFKLWCRGTLDPKKCKKMHLVSVIF